MMKAEMVFENLGFGPQLTQLVAREFIGLLVKPNPLEKLQLEL
jgi:hypothetical protein